MTELGPQAWDNRWREANTPWDLEGVTPALSHWQKSADCKGSSILVPGCGGGHDAHFLAKRGARVTAVDFAPVAIETAQKYYPSSAVTWELQDVTSMTWQNQFHRVWEYTCFCALPPESRRLYFKNIHQVLKPEGVYWGMVFSSVPKPEAGPPFQIDANAFRSLLEERFEVRTFEEKTPRSIKARRDTEIWFEAIKR